MELIPNENLEFKSPTYIIPLPLTAEKIINRALWGLLILLMAAVLTTFFVDDLPGVVLNARNIARDGLWIMFCSYTIGELLKRIFRNKGRSTEEYKQAKQKAQEALDSLTEGELSARNEYCHIYEEEAFKIALNRKLSMIGIDESTYREKYANLSKKELNNMYGNELPKSKIIALAKINKLKHMTYDPSFFLSTVQSEVGMSPSQMYNAKREDLKNMLSSIVTTFLSSLCAVTIAGDLIFSFTIAALFSAIVKITITVIVGAFKAMFGWNLSMVTEINRYIIVVKEVRSLKSFYKNKKSYEN